MKITKVKVWLVEGVKYNWTLLKVYTDTGNTVLMDGGRSALMQDPV